MLDAQVIRGKLRQAREKLDRAKLAYRDHPQYPNRVTPAVIAQVISEQTAIPIQSVMSHERPHYISLEEDLSKAVCQAFLITFGLGMVYLQNNISGCWPDRGDPRNYTSYSSLSKRPL